MALLIISLETATSRGRRTGGHEGPGVCPHFVQRPFADIEVAGAKVITIIAKKWWR